MQRNKGPLTSTITSSSSSSSQRSATASLRRSLKTTHESDDDDISDPRPWETRGPLNLYGSSKDNTPSALDRGGSPVESLPLYEMETRRRTAAYGEKEVVAGVYGPGLESTKLLDDDSGKYGKGFGVGPGYGGRRGLPPRQRRIPGWVS